jgi:CRP-like cAMP-binding protein
LGERSMMEGGHRTSTLRAVTPARVAILPADQIDKTLLTELRTHHLAMPDAEKGPASPSPA